MLIQAANACTIADKIAAIERSLDSVFDGGTGILQVSQDLLTLLLALEEYEQLHDMMEAFKTAQGNLTVAQILTSVAQSYYTSLNTHVSTRGSDLGISNIPSYLEYYNRGDGGTWLALVPADFARFCTNVGGATIAIADCFPDVSAADQTNPGMGRLTYSTTFLDGIAYTDGAVDAKLKVATTVTGGSTAGFIITGVNHAGVADTIWTAVLDLGIGQGTVGTEVDLHPEDGVSRLRNITAITPDPDMTWSGGAVFVKPLVERAY